MQDELCELRFDIPLQTHGSLQNFEQGWRTLLAAQGMTALAAPPAQAIAARFRICGQENPARLTDFLKIRLAALPGNPAVAAEPSTPSSDWQGVRVWLEFRSRDLAGLLQKAKHKPLQSRSRFSQGRRP